MVERNCLKFKGKGARIFVRLTILVNDKNEDTSKSKNDPSLCTEWSPALKDDPKKRNENSK